MASLKFFFIFITCTAIFLTPISCEDYQNFIDCHLSFECGLLQNLTYPFWNTNGNRPVQCGLKPFSLTCRNVNEYPLMYINGTEFLVKKIDSSSQIITLARSKSINESCPMDITLDGIFLNYSSAVNNLTLFYTCKTSPVPPPLSSNESSFSCGVGGESGYYSALSRTSVNETECGMQSKVLISEEAIEQLADGNLSLGDALKKELDLDYKAFDVMCDACEKSDGICGSDYTRSSQFPFTCLCRDGPHLRCDDGGGGGGGGGLNWKLKVGIGIGAAFVGVVITCIIFYLYIRRIRKQNNLSFYSRSYGSSVNDLENGSKKVGIHTFSYKELEEATNCFDEARELGDGGFGTVYKGKLRDGRDVAVKRLYENNYKRVAQFSNEVEILAGLRHTNLVLLYGCTSRHSRELLLVYEYVPNGTVADHLHGDRSKLGALTWPVRLKIAIETASALEYLHATDIIHRDVKTANILLDNNFQVKVADFGLSRLFPSDVSHVSTTPQGTPGYVDPEYHECYQLTSKSDVFSYGVVLIELISSMTAVDITRHRQEINLWNMAINRIEKHELHEIVDPCLGFEKDWLVRKTVTQVAELAFKCIQSGKEMRPTMAQVLESLKSIQAAMKAEEMDTELKNSVSSPGSVAVSCFKYK